MILIYCNSITNRIKYTVDLIFNTILLADVEITDNIQKFEKHQGPKISYGPCEAANVTLRIDSSKILFQTEIVKQNNETIDYNGYKVLFPTNGGELPFDPFATIFYLVTRYEEYLPSVLDNHKRYKPESSVAFQKNFLKLPIANLIAKDLKSIILAKHPNYFFKPKQYKFNPTLDIDNAYAYKHKGFFRTTLSILRLLIQLKFKKLYQRVRIVFGIVQDPYDSYQKQIAIHDQYGVIPKYFFLLGDYNQYDKNIHHNNKHLVELINRIDSKYPIGIHPSYYSGSKETIVNKEISRLEKITGHKVESSRQHYLRLKLPDTYQCLIQCGIKNDYSMGYSTQLGFRASICTPFKYFDLSTNLVTDLTIHPFVAMDSTFKYFLKIRASEVTYHIKPIYDIVKSVDGEMCIIFHNESIGTHKVWKNWVNTYENLIKLCIN